MNTSTSNTQLQSDSFGKRILKASEYNDVCDFIDNYHGLAIDCGLDLIKNYPLFHRLTLKSILETELTNRMRSQYWRYEANAKKYLTIFEERSKKSPQDSTILLSIAREEGLGPVMMCRSLLKIKYELISKMELNKLMRHPHLIKDPLFSSNVTQCMCSDSQDGPLIDLRRRVVGEEYEFKLKEMANAAGMHYYDENDLRRLGYDKTPDIKIIIPFLYKGEVINWIESKANFGDVKTHKWHIQQQLNSYCNRFGAGIVIYWFGYHETTAKLPDNSIGIIVLDDFPAKHEIELLDLSESNKSLDIKETDTT